MTEELISGIYVIENNETHHKYIGQGEVVEKRMWGYHEKCKAIADALKVYGKENFTRYVIEYCPIENLDEREKYWIKELHSHVSEGGYNVSWGGESFMRGLHHSPETIEKFRDGRRRGENAYWHGKHFSEEQCRKMSEDRMGDKNPNYNKPKSEKTKKLISDAQKGEKSVHYGQYGYKNPMFAVKHENPTSIYFGVSMAHKNRKNIKWVVSFYYESKKIWVGTFKTELLAARAYNNYVIEHNLTRPLNILPD